MERDKDRVQFKHRMVCLKAISRGMRSTALESSSGKTVKSTKDNSESQCLREREGSFTRMEKSHKASGKRITTELYQQLSVDFF